jgi:hypothetical protein
MTLDSGPERKFWQIALSDLERQPAASPNGLSSAEAERSSPLTRRWRKTDSNSRSLREGKGCGQPLQASIAVSDLNL